VSIEQRCPVGSKAEVKTIDLEPAFALKADIDQRLMPGSIGY
jgi:hypothetical protein